MRVVKLYCYSKLLAFRFSKTEIILDELLHWFEWKVGGMRQYAKD